MKTIELQSYFLTDPNTGKRSRSRWVMTKEQALKHDPKAEPVPGTLELRRVPDSDEELRRSSHSSW